MSLTRVQMHDFDRNHIQTILLRTIFMSAALAAPLHAQQALSFHDAIRIGLAQAPEARTSADRVEVQRSQIAQAKLRPNPRLFLSSEDLRPGSNDFSFVNNTEDFGYFGENFEIDGKRGKRIDYARGGLRRSEAQHAFELGQLSGGIANAYWAAAATREAAGEWQHQLGDFSRIVQYETDRVQSGADAGVDLLRVEIERDRAALSAAQAVRDAQAASIELARRTASLAVQTAQLTDSLEQERPVAELSATAAVEQRADVIAAREALTEARADLRLQHANGVPDLNFLGGYKRNSGVNTEYGALQVDLPFFNRNQGGIALASADGQLAEDQLAYNRLTAASEIAMAVSTYHQEQALVHSTLPGMGKRATQNAAIIGEAYRSGGADLLRYLDAEHVLIETRLLAIQTWAEYQRAVVSLKLAYGELL